MLLGTLESRSTGLGERGITSSLTIWPANWRLPQSKSEEEFAGIMKRVSVKSTFTRTWKAYNNH